MMLNIAEKSSILMDFDEIWCRSEFATVPDNSNPKSTKIRKMKNIYPELYKTSKIIKIRPIALENDAIKVISLFFKKYKKILPPE